MEKANFYYLITLFIKIVQDNYVQEVSFSNFYYLFQNLGIPIVLSDMEV